MTSPREFAKSSASWFVGKTETNQFRRKLIRLRQRIETWVVPIDFEYGRYPHTFLERRPAATDTPHPGQAPSTIWCFWTGENPLTIPRAESLRFLRENNPEFTVELITPQRLTAFILPDAPLHAAYEHLSYVHRSDYLRAYFLHHYGGGYADLKPFPKPWRSAYTRFIASEYWLSGPKMHDADVAGDPGGKLEMHLRRYHHLLPSSGALLARSGTPLTSEWMREVERRLDYFAPALRESPGGVWGSDSTYPIKWMDILGNVLHPLSLKYNSKVYLEPSLQWDANAPYR